VNALLYIHVYLIQVAIVNLDDMEGDCSNVVEQQEQKEKSERSEMCVCCESIRKLPANVVTGVIWIFPNCRWQQNVANTK